MHVGYVVKRFPRVSETFIAQEILELERQGVDVTVLALRDNDQPARHCWLTDLDAEIVRCDRLSLSEAWRSLHREARKHPERAAEIESVITTAFRFPNNRGKRSLSSATVIREEIHQRGIDHLHAHFANQPAFVAALAHRLSGRTFSFTGHAKDLYADALPDALLASLLERASFMVTVTEDNRAHLAERLPPALADRISVVYNGVDLPATERSFATPADRPPTALCVARLVEKKGIDVLLEAAARLEGEARIEIVGDGPLRESLHERARRLGLDGTVAWTGALPHEAVLERLRRSDLFVLPCRLASDGDRDALPTVLLEAMASGLPAISTPIGGVGEIIEPGVTGLLVEPERPAELAGAIDRLLRLPWRREQMGTAARLRAERLFDRATNVARLRAHFEAVAAPGATIGRPLAEASV